MSTFSSNIGPEEEDGAGWGGLVTSRAELRAEARQAALERDAARYRWLRDIGDATWHPMAARVPEGAAGIDAAVDAAMRRGRETP